MVFEIMRFGCPSRRCNWTGRDIFLERRAPCVRSGRVNLALFVGFWGRWLRLALTRCAVPSIYSWWRNGLWLHNWLLRASMSSASPRGGPGPNLVR